MVAAASLIALAPAARAGEDVAPLLTVSGTGRVSAPPDRARITAGVTTEAPSASVAVRDGSARMQRVLDALAKAGIPKKSIRTTRFDVSPVYVQPEPRAGGPPHITGYRASNQVEVEVDGVEKVGGVLDTLVAAGANDIGGISFEVADPTALLDQARRDAVADAQRKATLYAKAAGVPLGRIVRIEETGGGAPMPVTYRRMETAAAAPIAAGELDFSVSVTISWSLAP